MSDYVDDGQGLYTFDDLEDIDDLDGVDAFDFADGPNDEEQPDKNSNNIHDGGQLTEASFSAPQAYYYVHDAEQAGGVLHMPHCPIPSSVEIPQYGGPRNVTPHTNGHQADDPQQLAYVNPALLETPGSVYDQVSSFHQYSDPCADTVAQDHQSIGSWVNTNESRGAQFDMEIVPGTDQTYDVEQSHEQMQHVFARAQTGPEYSVSVPEPDTAFVHGIFGRQGNHQRFLTTYTDNLVDSLGAAQSDASVHAGVVGSRYLDQSTHSTHMAVISPPTVQNVQLLSNGGGGQRVHNSIPSRFQWIVRESTPVPVETKSSVLPSGLMPDDLLQPYSSSPHTSATSPADTDISTDILSCDDCSSTFSGEHRKGNLGRHRRHKHAAAIRAYSCEDDNCSRLFQRGDARLKHYRKRHPHLATGPALPRASATSNGVGQYFYRDQFG